MILFILAALAHPLDPVAVRLEQGAGEPVLSMRWSADSEPPVVAVGPACVAAPAEVETDGGMVRSRAGLTCDAPVRRLQVDAGERVAWVQWEGGETVLQPGQTEVSLQSGPGFAWLGIHHLLGGADHLALVVGLTALLGAGRGLIMAVTAFTVGHGLTLWMGALGWTWVAPWVAEAGIAASLVWLGTELWHPRESWGTSQTVAIPFAVGLLHGLGFAASLTGLSDALDLGALALFNLGIELGQIAVVLVMLGVLRVGLHPRWLAWPVGIYGGMLWVQRLIG